MDIINIGDYYFKQLKIDKKHIVLLNYAHKHPNELSKNDLNFLHIRCVGNNLKKLKHSTKSINKVIKSLRTNYKFWEQVLKNYAQDFQIPYIAPEHFERVKENFKWKKELDQGEFDFST